MKFSKKKILNKLVQLLQILVKKDKKIMVIGGWFGKRFADNSRYLYEYLTLNKEKFDLDKIIWITENKELYKELKENKKNVVLKKSLKSFYYHLKAKYHVIDQGREDIWGVLSASKLTKKINLWHGFPLKNIGTFAGEKIEKKEERGNWQEQNILVCSKYGNKVIGKAFSIIKEDGIYGMYPRNYYLLNNITYFLKKEIDILNKIKFKKNEGYKIIIYLPTFRDNKQIKFLGENSSDKVKSFLKKLEKNKYFFITKLHYGGTNIMKREKDFFDKYENLLNIPSELDIYPILKKSDLLITDYSSVYFDFLYLNREIIFFPYDLKEYKEKDRGLIFDYEEYTPGKKVFSIEELENYLLTEKKLKEDYSFKREKLKKKIFENYTLIDTVKGILK